jgi:hypothetical protein
VCILAKAPAFCPGLLSSVIKDLLCIGFSAQMGGHASGYYGLADSIGSLTKESLGSPWVLKTKKRPLGSPKKESLGPLGSPRIP